MTKIGCRYQKNNRSYSRFSHAPFCVCVTLYATNLNLIYFPCLFYCYFSSCFQIFYYTVTQNAHNQKLAFRFERVCFIFICISHPRPIFLSPIACLITYLIAYLSGFVCLFVCMLVCLLACLLVRLSVWLAGWLAG